jgi:hypothetical protein
MDVQLIMVHDVEFVVDNLMIIVVVIMVVEEECCLFRLLVHQLVLLF